MSDNRENNKPKWIRRSFGLMFCFVGFVALNAYKIAFVDRPFQQYLLPFDFPSLCVFVCISLILLFLVFCSRSRILFLLSYIAQSFFLFVHFAYFIYFYRPFYSRQFVMQLREGFDLLGNFAVPIHGKYWLMGIDLVPFILLLAYYPQVRALLYKHRKIVKLMTVVALAGLCFFLPTMQTSIEQYGKDIRNPAVGENRLMQKNGILGLDLLDSLAGVDERSAIQKISYGPSVTYAGDPQAGPQNIICIQVESLDSRVIDQQYHNAYVMPFLHQLAQETVYYPYMQYYIKAGSTSDAEFTALNGVLPLDNFVALGLKGYDFPNAIARRLGGAGYRVKAFHNNRADYFNRLTSFRKMGFQSFFGMKQMRLREQGWGASDGDVSAYMQNKLTQERKPFFYYFITMSSHEPFSTVGQYYKNPAYDDIAFKPVRNYYLSMSYVDNILRDLVGFISGHLKNTYVFIYGDHAPYTIMENDFFHPAGTVPLLIMTPDHQKYREDKRAANALDLAPTLLFAAGIDGSLRSHGVNLLRFPIDQDRILLEGQEETDRRWIFQKARNAKSYLRRPEEFVLRSDDRMEGKWTDSFESFSRVYQAGYKFMVLDISLTRDNRLVCLRDWDQSIRTLFQARPQVYSLNEFEKLRMRQGLTQITGRHLGTILKGYSDTYIIANFHFDRTKGLKLLSRERHRPLLLERVIPQVYSFKEYKYAKKLGFKKIIFVLRGSLYSDEQVLDFVRRQEAFAIVMPVDMALSGKALKFKRAGVFVYADSVDDPRQIQALKDNGVDGFYTHTLGP